MEYIIYSNNFVLNVIVNNCIHSFQRIGEDITLYNNEVRKQNPKTKQVCWFPVSLQERKRKMRYHVVPKINEGKIMVLVLSTRMVEKIVVFFFLFEVWSEMKVLEFSIKWININWRFCV